MSNVRPAPLSSQRGETAEAIRLALEDHRIAIAELRKIRKEMYEDFQKELALLARLESLVDE